MNIQVQDKIHKIDEDTIEIMIVGNEHQLEMLFTALAKYRRDHELSLNEREWITDQAYLAWKASQ